MKKPAIYVVRAMPVINDVTYFFCWRQSAGLLQTILVSTKEI